MHIPQGTAGKHLPFPHKAKDWRKSVVRGQRRVPFFISTEGKGESRVIRLHQDGSSSGRPLRRPADNEAESPTVVAARREMEAWRMLQLEPLALRRPDEFASSTRLGTDGSHLPATLYRLARNSGREGNGPLKEEKAAQIYGQIANRLHDLIDDVYDVNIDRDERREILTLHVKD